MTDRTRYRASAQRDPRTGTWAFQIEGIDGAFGDTRRLDTLRRDAADVLELALDLPDGSIDPDDIVIADVHVPELDELIRAVRAARTNAETAARQAATTTEQAARRLHEAGLPVRDVGSLLGVTFQRAHQLIGARR